MFSIKCAIEYAFWTNIDLTGPFICTGSNSKQSVIDWTKFLVKGNPCMENFVIVYRIKEKPGFLTTVLKDEKKKEN